MAVRDELLAAKKLSSQPLKVQTQQESPQEQILDAIETSRNPLVTA